MPIAKLTGAGRARMQKQPRPVPQLSADDPKQAWSWDITCLPTSVRGAWLYLISGDRRLEPQGCGLGGVRSGRFPDPAELVSRAQLPERISKARRQPLILHADNGNAMRAATLAARLEELGVLRSFSRTRFSNDNPFSESLFRTVKY